MKSSTDDPASTDVVGGLLPAPDESAVCVSPRSGESPAAATADSPVRNGTLPSVALPTLESLSTSVSDLSHQQIISSLESSSAEQATSAALSLIRDGLEDTVLVERILESCIARNAETVSTFASTASESSEIDENVKRAWKELSDDGRNAIKNAVVVSQARRRLKTWRSFAPDILSSTQPIAAVEASGTPSSSRRSSEPKVAGDVGERISQGRLQLSDQPDESVEIDDPWAEAEDDLSGGQGASSTGPLGDQHPKADDETVEVDDDPWNDHDSASSGSKSPSPASVGPSRKASQTSLSGRRAKLAPPISLARFLLQPVLQSALDCAEVGFLPGLGALRRHHADDLFMHRLEILDYLPEWTSPGDLAGADLLPLLDSSGAERHWTSESLGPTEKRLDILTSLMGDCIATDNERPLGHGAPALLSSEEVSLWYTSRVDALDTLGLLDLQVAWVQQAASLGISGMDRLGEDLSLLSRLVYDSHLTESQQEDWTLETWVSASPIHVINAYLSNSTPSSIVSDLRRLVLPYLYVLESRAERSGHPDLQLVNNHLKDIILSLSLPLALPLFEQSKATLPKSERIIKDDQTVARLALACLYGSSQKPSQAGQPLSPTTQTTTANSIWITMSAIFECLPVWDMSDRDPENDAELTATTLDSIAAFIRPSATNTKPPNAADLYMFFHPLPFASLSRALDILDVHLESGEILSRWAVPIQLRFLLQSARDGPEQVELAERMVRKAGATGASAGLPANAKARGGDEAMWTRLWTDMLKLNGGGDQLLRGAFGMVDGADLMRVYLGSVIRSGKMDIARKTIKKMEMEHGLKATTLEAVVLSTSRELYEGAESGNLHTGDMKIAYDCLGLAPASPSINTERAFIEATSRLSTFSLPPLAARSVGTLSPQEIRHARNRLDLIELVLSHSADSFRHDEMIFDLATKLGLRSQTQKARIWGMLAMKAGERGGWEMGAGYLEQVTPILRELEEELEMADKPIRQLGRASPQAPVRVKAPDERADESSEMAKLKDQVWRAALLIGGSVELPDIDRRMWLLGVAVEYCPTKDIPKVLEIWRPVEEGRIKLDIAAKRRRLFPPKEFEYGRDRHERSSATQRRGRIDSASSTGAPVGYSLGSGAPGGAEEERMLGSRRAARAAKMAFDIGGRLGRNLPALPRSASPSSAFMARSSSMSGGASGEGGRRVSGESRRSGEFGRALDAIAFGNAADGETSGHGQGQGQMALDEVERVRRGARRALRQGVGWLLGAEEGEI